MAQVLRVGALGVSIGVWLLVGLVAMPAIEGHGGASLFQHLVTSAFLIWLLWAIAAIAYDRQRA